MRFDTGFSFVDWPHLNRKQQKNPTNFLSQWRNTSGFLHRIQACLAHIADERSPNPTDGCSTSVKKARPRGMWFTVRRAHKVNRRIYLNERPNAVWHADGYDKLQPYGFAIQGCIDGWSRKVLWLLGTCSNNYPDNIASYFFDTVKKLRISSYSQPFKKKYLIKPSLLFPSLELSSILTLNLPQSLNSSDDD